MVIGGFCASAMESSALVNDSAQINATMNDSAIQAEHKSSETNNGDTIEGAVLNNSSLFNPVLDSNINQSARNLSTVNDEPRVTVPISDLAKNSPEVAAGASSAQISTELTESYKLGSGLDGLNPFNTEHAKVKSLELGMETKPIRDTSKLFFVCDIV